MKQYNVYEDSYQYIDALIVNDIENPTDDWPDAEILAFDEATCRIDYKLFADSLLSLVREHGKIVLCDPNRRRRGKR